MRVRAIRNASDGSFFFISIPYTKEIVCANSVATKKPGSDVSEPGFSPIKHKTSEPEGMRPMGVFFRIIK
jgi:hypothetical protein